MILLGILSLFVRNGDSMTYIVSKLRLENVNANKLQKFIKHWEEIKDLPTEKIEFNRVDEHTLLADFYYPIEIFDKSVTQFITVLYGELSFMTNFGKVTFLDLKLPDEVFGWFEGPKFGAEDVLKRFGVSTSPILIAIVKPSLSKELSPKIIENKIKEVLKGGFHGIKDDEMQGNLSFISLKDRIRLAKKYEKYIPTINLDCIDDYKRLLAKNKSDKIGMVLINASTIGFPMLHEIRKITKVPILSHVSLEGVYANSFSPKLFAFLHRLFGCDAFTNPIGDVDYFNVTREEEKKMAIEFTRALPIKKTLPLLTGGARLHNLKNIINPYEELKIPYGVVFGSLVFSSDKPPEEMCKLTVELVKGSK